MCDSAVSKARGLLNNFLSSKRTSSGAFVANTTIPDYIQMNIKELMARFTLYLQNPDEKEYREIVSLVGTMAANESRDQKHCIAYEKLLMNILSMLNNSECLSADAQSDTNFVV